MKKHDFSLLINDYQVNMLNKIMKLKGEQSEGKMIAYLVEKMMPYIKLKHFKRIIQKNKYKRINWVKKVHVILQKRDYGFLKIVHKNLDTYSIGQIIRELLDLFFLFFLRFGSGCFVMLKDFLENITRVMAKKKIWKNTFGELPELFHLRVDYDANFNVICIQQE